MLHSNDDLEVPTTRHRTTNSTSNTINSKTVVIKLPSAVVLHGRFSHALFVLLIVVTCLGKWSEQKIFLKTATPRNPSSSTSNAIVTIAGLLNNVSSGFDENSNSKNNNDGQQQQQHQQAANANAAVEQEEQQQTMLPLGMLVPLLAEYNTLKNVAAADQPALPPSSYSMPADSSPPNSFSRRLVNAESSYLANRLAKAGALENILHPRFQRWLLRAETLDQQQQQDNNDDEDDEDSLEPNGQQFAVKRVVSESELNTLLKNAWLGR